MLGRDYRFLEHTTDVEIEAYGFNLEEAFENAAKATIDVMTDVNSIKPVDEEDFKIKAFDLESLLYNWIEELLFRFDTRNMLYSKFEVAEIKDNEECLLLGRIWGEPFDLNKHPQKTGVKAVTYHRMEIKRKGEKVQLNFILDI